MYSLMVIDPDALEDALEQAGYTLKEFAYELEEEGARIGETSERSRTALRKIFRGERSVPAPLLPCLASHLGEFASMESYLGYVEHKSKYNGVLVNNTDLLRQDIQEAGYESQNAFAAAMQQQGFYPRLSANSLKTVVSKVINGRHPIHSHTEGIMKCVLGENFDVKKYTDAS